MQSIGLYMHMHNVCVAHIASFNQSSQAHINSGVNNTFFKHDLCSAASHKVDEWMDGISPPFTTDPGSASLALVRYMSVDKTLIPDQCGTEMF